MSDTVTANVQRNLYGLGFSPLSMKNKDHAFDNEMLANKEVGVFFIKSPDGSIVSAEHAGRCKKHFEAFMQKCIHENTIGKIYKVNIDDQYIQTVISDDNLFVNAIEVVLDNKINAFRFNLDADLLTRADCIAVDPEDVMFEIQFSLIKNGVKKSFYVSENFVDINTKAFAVDYDTVAEDSVSNSYGFSLDAFTVRVPGGFDETKQSIVIHDVLFALI